MLADVSFCGVSVCGHRLVPEQKPALARSHFVPSDVIHDRHEAPLPGVQPVNFRMDVFAKTDT